MNSRLWTWGAGLVLILIIVLHGVRITGVHGWSDDGASYLRFAFNLLAGLPYGCVKYFAAPGQAPPSLYPPALPVLLMPLIQTWGMDFRVFQIAMLVVFAASLLVSLAALWRTSPPWEALSAIAVLGVNPTLGALGEHINSDYLALFFIALLVWLVESFDWREARGWPLAGRSAAAALLIAAATETRTNAAVLVGALLLCSLWRYRRLTAFSIAGSAGAAVLIALLSGLASSGNYLQQLQALLSATTLRRNLIQYTLSLGGFVGIEPVGAGRWLALPVAVCAAYGAWRYTRSSRPFWMALAMAYLPVMVLWPYSDPERFLLPVLPIGIACLLRGLRSLADLLPAPARIPALAGVTLLAIGVSARAYLASPPPASGMNHPVTRDLYRAVERLTGPGSFIAFRKPRSLALFTERRSVGYAVGPPDVVRRGFCTSGVTHVISAPSIFQDDSEYLAPVISSARFKEIFRNQQYSLYEVKLDCGALPAPGEH